MTAHWNHEGLGWQIDTDGECHVGGVIDIATAPLLRRRLVDWLGSRNGPRPPVLDLTGVALFTAAGVTLLIEVADQRPDLVVRPSNAVDRVLRLCGVRRSEVDEHEAAQLVVAHS